MMHDEQLKTIAQRLLAPGKGLLAADESAGSITQRLEAVGVASTPETRRAYRELLLTTPRIGDALSGVILYDETFRDSTSTGESFLALLGRQDILPGIKVDEGTEPMEGSPEEKVTKGLAGLPERLPEYARMGAAFAKWRAIITIAEGIPTDANLRENARRLAAYAKLCQDNGIVPLIEPEVLMDGENDLAECARVSERNLTHVFEEVARADILLAGLILKTNMVVPGKKSGQPMIAADVAKATIALFKKTLPDALAGVVFLSGGQSEVDAAKNLNAIKQGPALPWPVTFSYSRSLQNPALAAWEGKAENVAAAQKIFAHRVEMARLATLGEYTAEAETAG